MDVSFPLLWLRTLDFDTRERERGFWSFWRLVVFVLKKICVHFWFKMCPNPMLDFSLLWFSYFLLSSKMQHARVLPLSKLQSHYAYNNKPFIFLSKINIMFLFWHWGMRLVWLLSDIIPRWQTTAFFSNCLFIINSSCDQDWSLSLANLCFHGLWWQLSLVPMTGAYLYSGM